MLLAKKMYSVKRSVLLSVIFASILQTAHLSEWSTWKDWSPCSRTCGGGITAQYRHCVQDNRYPYTCEGESTKYSMCNIQDCPEDAVDYRMTQCQAFNSQPYKGKRYRWTSFAHAAGECELKCMPKGELFYVAFSERVLDGTRCNAHTNDVCVNGTCLPVGCDMQLYSSSKLDMCGVCNGDNSTCKLVSKTYTIDPYAFDYVKMAAIPIGATHIRIEEKGNAKNYIAISSSGENVLNNDYIFSSSGKKTFKGSLIRHSREPENRVTIDGPLTAQLDVQIFVMDVKQTISYEYYAPLNFIPVTQKKEYIWEANAWSDCSKTCASGSRERQVVCIDKDSGVEGKEFLCKKNEKPHTEEECNPQGCPASWYISDWSPCSQSCGVGSHSRRVHCVETIKDGNINMLSNERCEGETPITIEPCTVVEECPRWRTQPWSKCSSTCGQGNQEREVYCSSSSENNVNDSHTCPQDSKPASVKKCFNAPCGSRWQVGPWSNCSAHCGLGTRSRSVVCRDTSGHLSPADHCDVPREPPHFEECQAQGKCPPIWHATPWSKCTSKCGYGMQMRNTLCVEQATDQLTIVAKELCTQTPPPTTRRCLNTRPCTVKYFVSPWKQCSVTCGKGIQLRDVRCYADRVIDKSEIHCKNLTRPESYKECTPARCPGEKTVVVVTTTTPATTTPSQPSHAEIVSFFGPGEVHESDNADFQCLVSGHPQPKITWHLNNQPITGSRFHVLDLPKGSRLVILEALHSDAGELTCTAENSDGRDVKTLPLAVFGEPRVSFDSLSYKEDEGESFKLTCVVHASPLPRVQWTKDGRLFYGDSDRVTVNKNEIEFDSLLLGDSGSYQCSAYNEAGSDEATVAFVVKRKEVTGTVTANCFDDNTKAQCSIIDSVKGLCKHIYYKQVCCTTCSKYA